MKTLKIEGKEVNIPDEWYEEIKKQIEEPKKPNYHDIHDILSPQYSPNITNCTSRKQCDKLEAINRTMNVAKFLNGDWKPKWNVVDGNYYIFIHPDSNVITTDITRCNRGVIFFQSRELAQQAVDILGEDTIKLALSTDW